MSVIVSHHKCVWITCIRPILSPSNENTLVIITQFSDVHARELSMQYL